MSELYIYNSLSRKKEKFEPLNPPFVGLYVCGPTVYSDVHLGNVRSFTTFDMVYRYLKYLGYHVRYVRNITDAGHLTNEQGEGKNRMEDQAKLEQLEPMEIVQKYTVGFHEVMQLFNNLPPTIEPTATGHILEQIEMAEQLIENGVAYEANGSVYFDVKAYNEKGHNYGELSGRNVDELIAGYRDLDGQDEKKNSIDFALWKKASPEHIMQWSSPWGKGFPGWHLECSVMSTKYLGKQFDIHGGGMDLKFPHHECEIAQNVGACGLKPVRYWMHGNMLNFNGQKMSKSLGNSILPIELITGNHQLLDKAYSPMTVRMLFFSSHYSSELDINIKGLQDAEKNLRKLMNAAKYLQEIKQEGELKPDPELEVEIMSLCLGCKESMDDDFNTAKTIANLLGLASHINTFYNGGKTANTISVDAYNLMQKNYVEFLFDILGFKEEENNGNNEVLNKVMNLVIDIRKAARENKDWPTSDKIRDGLTHAGIIIKDEKDGTTFEVSNA
ncbi:MAG TPA: cysteine--tRNA ligase [Chitinophagales bacterium]|nr:cysteine--tRNA ligase [Chitinophagales bacterium]HNL83665.1 cysteine--tRNA ligase [Chitinophagales bacterium]